MPAVVAALGVALAGVAAAQPSCPADGATIAVFAENLSDDPSLAVTVSGELLDPAGTCAGAGDTAYDASLTCAGAGLVQCGRVAGLRPGGWVSHLRVTVAGSAPQVQHQRAVFVARGASNALVWTIYPRTLVVAEATHDALRAALAAASPGPALVTFSAAAFPGAGSPRTIDLAEGRCASDLARHAGICFADSHVVVDALDASGRPGAVRLSIGTQTASVLQVFGSDNVFRGLVFDGSRTATPTVQMDTVAFTGAAAQRNRIEQAVVHGPTMGDAVSADTGAGLEGDDANVIDACEVSGARDKGVKVTTGAHLTVRRSCLHENQNGGVQSTLGGHAVVAGNLIQHNVPGASQNGISVRGNSMVMPPERTTGTTDGNIIRFAGGRGLSVTDNATADFANDYVADSQFAGSKVETTDTPFPGTPRARFRGVAFVCNGNAGISGTCQPQFGADGTPCGTDADCCGIPSSCCVTDPGCSTPLRCQALAGSRGFGATQAQAAGHAAPDVDYGNATEPGRNAFAWNQNAAGGVNFNVNVPELLVPAEGNQWEHCGTAATCDTAMVMTGDVLLATEANVSLGAPAGPRAGAPVPERISPARPRKGDLVRVFGENFNAIDGTACAHELAPADPCSGENPWVEAQNRLMDVNSITILAENGTALATAWPDAVTPAMLAFRMPFDCFAPLTLRVAKRDPSGAVVSGTAPLCDPGGCDGQPANYPCDDGDACTVDDRCDGSGVCRPGAPAVCHGRCLTGTCDAGRGCVPKPATTSCDDGDACTTADHCSGETDACVGGAPRECRGACLGGTCDRRTGCTPKPADAACEDGDPCTAGDHCSGDRDVCVPGSAACDDADPCTENDLCSAGVCRGARVRGFDGAICELGKLVAAPICAPDPGLPRLDRMTSSRVEKAQSLLRRAAGTPKPAVRDQLVRQSAALLQDVERLASRYKRLRKISRECAAAIKGAVGEQRRLVMGLVV